MTKLLSRTFLHSFFFIGTLGHKIYTFCTRAILKVVQIRPIYIFAMKQYFLCCITIKNYIASSAGLWDPGPLRVPPPQVPVPP